MANINRQQSNIWDKLITFYLILLAFGSIGGALTPIRVFTISMLPLMLYKPNPILIRRRYLYERIFLICWSILAFGMILIAMDTTTSLKYWLHLTLNMYAFFVLIWMANKAANPQKAIATGWIAILIITLPIACWEFLTDQHLPWSYWDSDRRMNFGSGNVIQRRFAAIAFGNLNVYNFILCYIFSFLVLKIIKQETTIIKFPFFNWILLVILCLIIIFNSSRASILCLSVGLLCLGIYFLRNSWKMLTILTLFMGVALYIAIQNDLFLIIFSRFSNQGLGDTGRIENIMYGTKALIDSNLLGIGTGNYTPVMEKFGLEITAPHNILIEIATQFGIFILMGYLYLLFRILRKGMQNPQKANKVFVLITILLYPFVHIINSGYLLNTEFWLFLASILIIADKNYNYQYDY